MKKISLTIVFLCLLFAGYSQTDTLFTKKHQKIACKITEIGEYDIVYILAASPDGPRIVINKASVIKYTLASGYTEVLLPDELSLENEHADILKNRRVIKISPFSLVNNQISLSYEKVVKVGMNIDIEAGYVNSNLNANPIIGYTPFSNTNMYGRNDKVFHTGAYVKPGLKFFLGKDYTVKGLRYAHPLKGHYVRLDFALSYLNFQDVKRYEYASVVGPYYYSAPTPTREVTTNVNSFSYGGFVNFGRQFILGNILTMDIYAGFGFTGQSSGFSNPEYLKRPTGNYWQPDGKQQAASVSNYHGFMRIPGVGLSGTFGFRVGYILPDETTAKKKPVIPQ